MSNYIITTLQTAVSVGILSGYVRYSLHQAFEMLFFEFLHFYFAATCIGTG